MAPRPGMFQGGDTGRSDSRNFPEEEHLCERGEGGKLLERDNGPTPDREETGRGVRNALSLRAGSAPLTLRCAGSPLNQFEKQIGRTPSRT